MALTNQTKRLSFSRTPLRPSGTIEITGSVPGRQEYQAELGEHTPDYTLTSLTLFPRCNATDPNLATKGKTVNAALTNMKWYRTVDGVRTLIATTDTDYAVTQSGEEKGKLQVKKNVMPGHALSLEFYAEYVDSTRPGDAIVFRMSFLVICTDSTEAAPVLMIDSPASLDWNPLRDTARQKITVRLLAAGMDVAGTDKCRIFFYRMSEGGALELISDGNGENDWEVVSVTDNTLTIDRDYIGAGQTYVVKAGYDENGNPPSSPDEAISPATTTIRRRIPALECDWEGVPRELPDGNLAIQPYPVVRDTKGVLDDPWDVLRADWYTALSSSGSYTLKARGSSPDIPFTEGMMLKLEVADRGPYAILTNANGTKVLTDGEGRVLMARKSN